MTVRKVILAIVAAVAAFALFGLFLTLTGYVPPADPAAHVISGTFTLVDEATAANGCVGPSDGSWREVRPGATVWVRYDSFFTRSAGLGDGRVVTWGQFGAQACAYDFSVVDVPTATSYTIDYPGGLSLRYTFEELESKDWSVGPVCCDIVPAN